MLDYRDDQSAAPVLPLDVHCETEVDLPGLIRAGVPSGMASVAHHRMRVSGPNQGKAIKWVKETFSGRPAFRSALLSSRRLASRTPTGSSRNVVAVGTARLSSMLPTS